MSNNDSRGGHTPGPWAVYESDEVIGVTCRTECHLDSDGDGADICEIVNRSYFGVEVAKANAQLIASAPSLLSRVARLEEAIRNALHYANGRESEWGERAEGAFEFLYNALSSSGEG